MTALLNRIHVRYDTQNHQYFSIENFKKSVKAFLDS